VVVYAAVCRICGWISAGLLVFKKEEAKGRRKSRRRSESRAALEYGLATARIHPNMRFFSLRANSTLATAEHRNSYGLVGDKGWGA